MDNRSEQDESEPKKFEIKNKKREKRSEQNQHLYRERIDLLFLEGVGIAVAIHGVSDPEAFDPQILLRKQREKVQRERESESESGLLATRDIDRKERILGTIQFCFVLALGDQRNLRFVPLGEFLDVARVRGILVCVSVLAVDRRSFIDAWH